MLGAHTDDTELLGNSFETTIQIEAMHERLDVQHVREVVLQELFKVLPGRWQAFVHHDLDHEAKVLVAMEADPGEMVVEHKPR